VAVHSLVWHWYQDVFEPESPEFPLRRQIHPEQSEKPPASLTSYLLGMDHLKFPHEDRYATSHFDVCHWPSLNSALCSWHRACFSLYSSSSPRWSLLLDYSRVWPSMKNYGSSTATASFSCVAPHYCHPLAAACSLPSFAAMSLPLRGFASTPWLIPEEIARKGPWADLPPEFYWVPPLCSWVRHALPLLAQGLRSLNAFCWLRPYKIKSYIKSVYSSS